MPLLRYPHPVLSTPALPVKDADEAQFVEEVIREAIHYDITWGRVAGLAAPQVLLSKQAFIAFDLFFVNPRILWQSKETRLYAEGCFSLKPKKYDYRARRPLSLDLHYYDRDMVEHTESFSGKMAQVIHHEIDHLKGLTLIERGQM